MRIGGLFFVRNTVLFMPRNYRGAIVIMYFKVSVLFVILFSILAPLRGEDDTYIDERENWDTIIQQFHNNMERYRTLSRDMQAFIQSGLERFDRQCQKVDKRSHELKFLLWAQKPDDVFGLSLYCKQIFDLKTAFDQKMARLVYLRSRIIDDLDRVRILEKSLSEINRDYLTMPNYIKLLPCRQEIAEYMRTRQTYLDKVDLRMATATKIKKNLDELSVAADKRRNQAMEQIIFNRHGNFAQIFPLAKILFRFWFADAISWLAIQIPDNAFFWRNFVLILLCGGVPLLLLGRLMFRQIIKNFSFTEKYAKKNVFMIGWGLLIVAGACLSCIFMLGEVESSPFVRLGEFLFALACLIMAVGTRVDMVMFRRCMLLYIPLMAQHLAGIMLCTLLVPSQPLMLLVPILNLPVIVATFLLLWYLRCPLLDRIFSLFTVLFAMATMVLAIFGLSYIAFVTMMVWFVVVAGIQTGMAITRIVREYTAANSHKKIMTCLLFTLLTPVMWMTIIGGIIYWTAGLFNAQPLLRQILFADVLNCRNVLEVSLIDLITALIGGLLLQFMISTTKHVIRILAGEKAEMGLIPSFLTLGTYLAWGIYLIFLLVLFNVHPSSILVVLGGMSMGVGFGMKEIVENFISGIILLAGKQLRPGDQIEFNGIWGRVRKVSVRATVVDTDDNSVITFPNSQVLSKDFRNWTLNHSSIRKEIKVGVAYGSDVQLVMRLLSEIVENEHNVMKSPRPDIFFTDFGDNALMFTIRVWMSVSNRHMVPSNIRIAIDRVFAENGISIPFPQLDVHFDPQTVAVRPELLPGDARA